MIHALWVAIETVILLFVFGIILIVTLAFLIAGLKSLRKMLNK